MIQQILVSSSLKSVAIRKWLSLFLPLPFESNSLLRGRHLKLYDNGIFTNRPEWARSRRCLTKIYSKGKSLNVSDASCFTEKQFSSCSSIKCLRKGILLLFGYQLILSASDQSQATWYTIYTYIFFLSSKQFDLEKCAR